MIGSSEARTERLVLASVEGMAMDDARAALVETGIADVQVHYTESYEPDFTVLAQRPNAGEVVDARSRVVLMVSRQSLVDYLPQIYQQPEEDGDSSLKNFLYIVQSLHDRVSRRLDTVHELFDPRSTEPEFLPWLASWMAITLSPEWSDLDRRKMLRAATELFPHRGTARSIESFVRIYTGAEVEVMENEWPFAGFRIGTRSTVGRDTVILPPMNLAHCFVVRIDRSPESVSDEEIIKIHQIIGAQKPAHTSYFLAFGEAVDSGPMGVFMEVGGGDAIGVVPDEPVEAAPPPSGRSESESGPARASRARKKATTPRASRAKQGASEEPASTVAAAKKSVAQKSVAQKSVAQKSKPTGRRSKKPTSKGAKIKGKTRE
jgi:phage tail-like protein